MFFLMVLPAGILAEAGVESRKIVLGTHQPLSGPMKNYAQIGRGASIYFQYLNDQGGIHGRQLFLLQRDDRFKPQRTLKLVEELVMKDRVFALFSGIGTETSESAMPLLKSQGVPHFSSVPMREESPSLQNMEFSQCYRHRKSRRGFLDNMSTPTILEKR